MKKVYFLVAILVGLISFWVFKNTVVFINVMPYINIKTMSIVAKEIKSINDTLDETRRVSAMSGHKYKYLYISENGSEYIKDNPIPNDMDFVIGIDLGTYTYKGDNLNEISKDIIEKINSFINVFTMVSDENGKYIKVNPVAMMNKLSDVYDEYFEAIDQGLKSFIDGKVYITKQSKKLKSDDDNMILKSYLYAYGKNEIWLYFYPKVSYFTDTIKLSEKNPERLNQLSFVSAFYLRLNVGNKVIPIKISPVTYKGQIMAHDYGIFTTQVFYNLYSRSYLNKINPIYYLKDDGDLYFKSRILSAFTHSRDFSINKEGGGLKYPVKSLKRLIQVANILRPALGEEKYQEIQNLVYDNLNDPRVQLLNETQNTLDLMHLVRISDSYVKMIRTNKIKNLALQLRQYVEQINADEKIGKETKSLLNKFVEKHMNIYLSSVNDFETYDASKNALEECIDSITNDMNSVIVDKHKFIENIDYIRNIFINAGYHDTYLYWIDTNTVGILKDDYTKNIKDLKSFAKDNLLADVKYVLIDKSQIPLESSSYIVYTRSNPSAKEEENFQKIKESLLNDRKNLKYRYHLRFGI